MPNAISLLAAGVWGVLVAAYLAQGRRQVLADLKDPVLAPFVPVSVVTAMLLSASLAHYAVGAGQVLVATFLAIMIALGGWMTGQWVLGDLDQGSVHPGHFLPTVAGGLVGAFAAAQGHLHEVAMASFGIGCSAGLAGIEPALLPVPATRRPLPDDGHRACPPALAGVAYLAITGTEAGPVTAGLAGYTVLMLLVQLRLLPVSPPARLQSRLLGLHLLPRGRGHGRARVDRGEAPRGGLPPTPLSLSR